MTRKEKNQIISESVISHILSDIKERRLNPGDKLEAQRKLAKKYDVGMSSIREALSALSILNIVETKHGKGVFVSNLSHGSLAYLLKVKLPICKKEVLDFYEVRKYLDVGAVEHIIKNSSDSEIARIEEVFKEMDSIIKDVKKGNNIEEYVNADIKLHHTIYELTGNDALITLVEFLNNNLVGNLGVYFSNEKATLASHKIHKNMVEMIKKRNLDRAKYYSRFLINSTIDSLKTLLKD